MSRRIQCRSIRLSSSEDYMASVVPKTNWRSWLAECGLRPRSHAPGEPDFDLAWESQGRIFVVEVKSLTDRNEEKQLRLGLGQVLRYKQVLSARFTGRQVVGVLAAERKPTDDSWLTLCDELSVRLVWPESMVSLF